MGHQFDEFADLEKTEQDLKEATEHDHGEGQRRAPGRVIREHGGVLGEDRRHDHRHGAGRSGDLGRGTAKEGGEEADKDGPIEAGDGAGSRGDAHGEGERQGNYTGRDTAIEIPPQVTKMQAMDKFHALCPRGSGSARPVTGGTRIWAGPPPSTRAGGGREDNSRYGS